jgi:hypothetical protein
MPSGVSTLKDILLAEFRKPKRLLQAKTEKNVLGIKD